MRSYLGATVAAVVLVVAPGAVAGANPSPEKGCQIQFSERYYGQLDYALCRGFPADHAGRIWTTQREHGKLERIKLGHFTTGKRGNVLAHFLAGGRRELRPGRVAAHITCGNKVTEGLYVLERKDKHKQG